MERCSRSRRSLWIIKYFKALSVFVLSLWADFFTVFYVLCFSQSHYLCVFFSGLKVESAALHEFGAAVDGSRRGVLLFPEICTMELQLLAAGSPDLDVLSHVFHSLLGAVHANRHNAVLLYEQVRRCNLPLLPLLKPYTVTNTFCLVLFLTGSC